MKWILRLVAVFLFYVLFSCVLEIVAGNSLRPPHPDVLKEQEIERMLEEDAHVLNEQERSIRLKGQ